MRIIRSETRPVGLGNQMAMELHPKFLTKDGKHQFAILPYEEFLALQELLEEMEDLIALRTTKQAEAAQPSVSLSEVKQMLDRR
jgi:hypothetical protein